MNTTTSPPQSKSSGLTLLRDCRRLAAFLLPFAVFLLVDCRPVQASTNLRAELAVVAKNVASLLKGLGEESIAMGRFTFDSETKLKATAGPGIAKILSEELQKAGIATSPDATWTVEGSCADVTDAKSGQLAAMISGKIVNNGTGQQLTTFRRGVFGDSALASLFGTTVELDPQAEAAARDKALVRSLDSPSAVIADDAVSASAESPYGIQILVLEGDNYVVRQPVLRDGQAFVEIARDEVYAIRVLNGSKEEAAAAVSIDGLSLFAFSENSNYEVVVLPAGSSGLIKGWHRSNSTSDAFQVMEYSKSAVAKLLPQSTGAGTITVTFAACFPEDAPPPEDEPPATKAREFARQTGDATGQGPRLEQGYREVRRVFGVTRSSVSVRYTSVPAE